MSDYVEEMEEKLKAARKRIRQGREMKAIKDSAPTLMTIIDGEISLELNRGYGVKPLSYEEYLASHGAARGIRRIRDLMNSKEVEAVPAVAEAKALEDNIKLVKSNGS